MTDNILPNFFILGAAKAGTTTLYDLLGQHPEIYLSFDKEPMFFSNDQRFAKGLQWYGQTFFQGGKKYPMRGEASPHYLYWAEKVAPRIRKMHNANSAKFIVVLRDPIQRGYSWYWNMVKDGYEFLSFVDALKAEEFRIRQNLAKLEALGSMQYGYYRGGCYATQIQEYITRFSRDQLKIVLLEDLQNDQANTLKSIFRFLCIDTKVEIKPTRSNVSVTPRSRFVHQYIKRSSASKNLVKYFLPYRLRHVLKSLMLKLNSHEFHYPTIESEATYFLKKQYVSEITRLSELTGREIFPWS